MAVLGTSPPLCPSLDRSQWFPKFKFLAVLCIKPTAACLWPVGIFTSRVYLQCLGPDWLYLSWDEPCWGRLVNFKSVSTWAPSNRTICHLTDFNELCQFKGSTPKLKATNRFPFGFFPRKDRPPPPPPHRFLGFHRGNRFKISKIYEARTAMVFNQLLWEFAYILLHL